MFHLLMCIWCLLIAMISGGCNASGNKRHPKAASYQDEAARYYDPQLSITIRHRSGCRKQITHSWIFMEILYCFHLHFLWSLIRTAHSVSHMYVQALGSRFLKHVFQKVCTWVLRDRDHVFFETRGNRRPLFCLIQFAHGPQTKEEPSIGPQLLMSRLVKLRVPGPAVIY